MVMRGEPQPKGDVWRKATIGSAAANDLHQRVWCEACGHELVISAEDLIELHGVPAEMSFWELAQKLKCGKCGSGRVGVMAASWNKARDLRGDD